MQSNKLNKLNEIMNARLLTILLLGFSSGLPLALTNSTLQAWFTAANVDVVKIGALSLLGIPYTLKFLWAPLMDHYRIPLLGRRRGWIILTQLCLVLALIVLSQMDPSSQYGVMGIVALCIAFFSASQDISIDAYRTDVLTPQDRGLGVSYFVFAYRIAMLVSGGLALVLAGYFGWKFTYECMAGFIFLSTIPAYFAPQPKEIATGNKHVWQTIFEASKDILQRDKILIVLLFVVFYKLGDALALSLMMNFLLHGLGFSLVEVGLAYKIVSFVATILGGFVGGILLLRWNIYRALMVFGLMQAFSNLMFALLAVVGKSFLFMTITIFIENFCSGLSTAAFLAFLMSLCNQRFSASQFALLTALAALGRVFIGPFAGVMVEHIGWVQLYLWSFALCFPGITLLLFLKDKVFEYAHATS